MFVPKSLFIFAVITLQRIQFSQAFSWGRGSANQPSTSSRFRQWGQIRYQEVLVVPCDGSDLITKACDTFCKSIRALEGTCITGAETCECRGFQGGFSTTTEVPSGTVGIHVVPAPDLSATEPTSEVRSTITAPEIDVPPSTGDSTSSSRKKRRIKRDTDTFMNKLTPQNSQNSCSRESCIQTCDAQGYGSCIADCIGSSCYCNCPKNNKNFNQEGSLLESY